jgi:hypothetical protein
MAAHPFVVAPVPRVRRRAGTAIGPDAVRGRVAAAGRVQPKAFEPPPHAAELLPRSSSIVGALSSTEVANQARALVAGDLNHEPDAATTLLLTGPPGSKIRTPRPSASTTRATATGSGTLAELIEPPESPVGGVEGHGEPGRRPVSFHPEAVAITDRACHEPACYVARHRHPERWALAQS